MQKIIDVPNYQVPVLVAHLWQRVEEKNRGCWDLELSGWSCKLIWLAKSSAFLLLRGRRENKIVAAGVVVFPSDHPFGRPRLPPVRNDQVAVQRSCWRFAY